MTDNPPTVINSKWIKGAQNALIGTAIVYLDDHGKRIVVAWVKPNGDSNEIADHIIALHNKRINAIDIVS